MIGSSEIVVIIIVILILFGSSALPKFAKSLGEAKREFERAMKDGEAPKDESPAKGESKKGN